jgi:GDP-L-fucose synthase
MIFRTSLLWKMQIQNNLIDTLQSGVEKFIFLGSSCIYPTYTAKREYLLTDTLEPTNEWYAIAK